MMRRAIDRCAVALTGLGIALQPCLLEAAGPAANSAASARATTAGAAAVAPANPAAKPLVKDLALGSGGTLNGSVVDRQGAPQANVVVVAQNGTQIVGRATSNRAGQFQINGLRGGVYQVSAADASSVVRAWSEGTAPPAADQATLLVAGGQVVRGQMPLRDVISSDAFIIGSVAVAAVAVPIIVHSSRKDSNSGS